FYQYNEEYADDYILPPCTDITNPRYLGYGSYYCMPKKQHLSDAAIAFLHLLLSEKSVNYFTNAENIFSIRPPRYCVTKVSSKTRLTSEDLEDYQIEDYGITSVTEQYQLFTYQRSHACREQQYHWSEMYPKLLTLIKHAMTDGFHSDTYDEIIKLLNVYQK
ncbi:MAG: hypothetical protein IKI37_08370, partial [Oscillospiraceae bacterium]|nr:hypothetical protein [Oscillospiraceae bacterium]